MELTRALLILKENKMKQLFKWIILGALLWFSYSTIEGMESGCINAPHALIGTSLLILGLAKWSKYFIDNE